MKRCKECWCINENPLLKYCMKHADMNKKLQTYKPLVQKTPLKAWPPPKKISKKRIDRIKDNWEAKMFQEIWNEREHICYICKKNIPEPLTFVFAHICPKWTYPELRNIKENLALVCSLNCHQEVDKLFSWIKRQEHIQEMYNRDL